MEFQGRSGDRSFQEVMFGFSLSFGCVIEAAVDVNCVKIGSVM